ncbi:MAG: hypothetical protein ABFD20_11925 [Anaerolineales bacterium]
MSWSLSSNTRIVISAGAAKPTQRAAAYLQSQVERRTGWRWPVVTGGERQAGDIVLGIVGDGSAPGPLLPEHPEEITLWAGEQPELGLYATAGGPSVMMAAAGTLARTLVLQRGQASLPQLLSYRHHASFPVRGHTYANHKQNNTCDKWSAEQWGEYLTEMAAWGDNIAVLYPLHPARSFGCLPFGDPPWFDSPLREREFYRQLEIQLKLPALCHELGMRYGVWLPVNDVYYEQVRRNPHLSKNGGSFVCPSIPEARAAILELRHRIFSLLPELDVLFFPSKDDGGCPGCEDCNPWAPVYLDLVQEEAAIARQYHPNCVVWLAQQGLPTGEARTVIDWLDRERPDWVEGIAYGPFSELMTFAEGPQDDPTLLLEPYGRSGPISGPVQRLRAAVPGQYKVILYPDEAHTRNCQYPVVTMDPVVQYVWNREDGPAPRALEMWDRCGQTAPAADGSAPYSEGDTDDLNKVVWSVRAWDFGQSATDIVHAYARWHFGEDCASEASELLVLLEKALNSAVLGNADIARAAALVASCEAKNAALLDNWRWLNVRICALMLQYIQRVMVRDRELLAELRYRIAVWRSLPDPRPGLKETMAFLERRFQETEGLLREIVWTRDRLFALHKLAIRGVAKLHHSFMRFDVVLQEWRELLARLERGELSDFSERYQALLAAPLATENGFLKLHEGVQIVPDLQEFPWETGKTHWHWS